MTNQTLTRRAALGALASLPAIAGATAALAMPEAAAPHHPDAELFQLEQELETVKVRMDKLERAQSRLSRKAEKAAGAKPLNPRDWVTPTMPKDLWDMLISTRDRTMFGDMVKDGFDWRPAPVQAWHEAVAKERAQIQAAWDEYSARCDEQHRLHDFDAKEAEYDDAVSEHWDIGQRIFDIPAHTLEGMAVKVRTAKSLCLPESGDALVSISADIVRLVQGGAA
ncbi:hypothetical protein LB553_05530 [Mesorhizobium sp. CA8]|uniref:hypothetical protein n=1 Tax=Mesorhizobium sp. CA8 TaxID=2876637 RepID=UPI001CCD9FBE|nr:hypothetical protein [Mesorhizobium sp. CA8]MBZ9760336.1 hypothetical protein [Mesorhizobium sp. CA8]